jgi:hypothetical protein
MTLPRYPAGFLTLTAGLTVCLALGLGATTLPNNLLTTPTSLFASIALASALWPILRRVLNGTIDIFEPVLGASIMLAILFGVRPLIMLSTGDRSFQKGYNIAQGFNQAVLLGMLGTLSFVVGYEVLSGLRQRSSIVSRARNLDLPATRRVVFVCVVLGLVLFLLLLGLAGNPLVTLQLLAHGRSTRSVAVVSTSSYLSDAPLLLACAATIFVITLRGKPTRGQLAAIIALVATPVAAFSLVGDRRFIIPCALIPIVVGYIVRLRRPSWRKLALIIPVAFIILATIPYARASGGRQAQGGVLPVFTRAFSAPLQPVGKFLTGTDTQMVSDLALEVESLRQSRDYYFGRATVGDLLLAPLPSHVIRKPQTARDSLLVRIFGEPCGTVNGALCPDFSAVGTFYQDFWIPGVIAGMLLLGGFSAALWTGVKANRTSVMRLILAASWTVFLPIIIRAGIMPTFSWWLEFILPCWLGVRYIERRTSEPISDGDHNRLPAPSRAA